jgi:integrase/recombinase XerC
MRELVEKYLEYLYSRRNYSKLTVKSYEGDLRQFFDFLEINRPQNAVIVLKEIDNLTIRSFLVHLTKRGVSNKSRGRKLAALRSFFSYLIREGYLQTNPAKVVSTPKAERELPSFFTQSEVDLFISKPDLSSPLGIRNAAMLELLYATGIRSAELVGLSIDDIDLRSKFIRVTGKGEKERLVPFGEPAAEKITKYLEVRRSLLTKNKNIEKTNCLFLNYAGDQITTRSIRRIVERYVRLASISGKLSPHSLRHTFATHMLNAGADLRSIQELLGHSSLSTTQKYTQIGINKLIETYRNSHPRAIKDKMENPSK